MKTTFAKIIAFLLLLSSAIGLSSCFEYKEELYPIGKAKRGEIIYIEVVRHYESKYRPSDKVKIPNEDFEMMINYIESSVPYAGIMESEYENYDYRIVQIYSTNCALQQYFVFQKDGETFIEEKIDAITFNYELFKADNALFDLIESYL